MNTDMTKGNPFKVLLRFSLPLLLSVVFQQLYTIADSIIAGRFAGEDALAAVGASYPITMIFMAIAVGCNGGCSVVVSQLFGAKKIARVRSAISTTFIAVIILSVFLTIIGIIFSSFFLKLLNTPENIFSDGCTYLRIYLGGLIFLFLYNICTGIFSAMGDSKTPLYFLIASSIANVVLDYVFVAFLKMGVSGVAWATFITQGIAGLLSCIFLQHRIQKICTISKTDTWEKFSPELFRVLTKFSVPTILQQSFVSVGNLFIQGLVNSYGSSVIAGYSAAIKLNTFALMVFGTLGNGISTFTAQNMGAGLYDRVKKGFNAGILLASITVLPFFICYFFFGNFFISLFLNSEHVEAIKTGYTFLRIVSVFYISIAIKLIADAVLKGAGAMKFFMVSTFTDLVLRVVLAFIMGRESSTGIWMSWPLGWVTAAIMSLVFYKLDIWKNKATMVK